MALVVNTNIFSINAQRNLTRTQGSLQTSLQRLSSGLRINSAKDDAAGSFSVEKLNADIRGANQAIRNANDGISLAQVAEGALSQIASNLQRIRELAVQSASDTIEDRTGLQAEVDQLTQEITRIAKVTEFNGRGVISASNLNSGELTFQIDRDGDVSSQITVELTGQSTVNLSSIAGIGSSQTAGLTQTGIVDISTADAASAVLQSGINTLGAGSRSLDRAIDAISQKRAIFGAVQNRFEAVISNLSIFSENLSAARSRIEDADFAQETAALTRSQILQQAGISILSQANQVPQQALSLLQ